VVLIDSGAHRAFAGHFSNRPFGVKHFQTIQPLQCRCRSRARASLRNRHQGPSIMGFEDEAEQSTGRPCHRINGRSKRPNELTSSIVPRGTSFHRSVELRFLLLHLFLVRSHAATISRVQRNSVPSTQMRCMITANRRASATMAFFIPRRLAICIAQALSHDHFFECTSMLCAAS
jgi:hypothetical protein